MTIRVKNKVIVLIVVIFGLALGLVKAGGGDYLFYRAETARETGDYVSALAHYDAFIERYPDHPRIPDALYWSAGLLPDGYYFQAIFFPTHSLVTVRSDDVPEPAGGTLTREERYLRIREEYPDHWTAQHADFKLAEIYYGRGDARAEALYLQTMKRENGSNRVEAAQRLIELYIKEKRLDEALGIVDYCRTYLPDHLPAQIQMSLGDIYAAQGDYESALAAYKRVPEIVESSLNRFLSHEDVEERRRIIANSLDYYQQLIDSKLSSLPLDGDKPIIIQGKVSVQGRPLPGVHVLVNPIKDHARSFPTGPNQRGLWITDREGRFQGELREGVYEVGIRLNYEQARLVEGTHLQIINGELALEKDEAPIVEFRFVEPVQFKRSVQDMVYTGEPMQIEWEPYPGAVYYGVSVFGRVSTDTGSLTTSSTIDYVEDTSYVLDNKTSWAFGSYGVDQEGVSPVDLLGNLLVFDELRVDVRAYDERGLVLASSSGLTFHADKLDAGTIPVGKPERSDVAELILSRKYDEGVEVLEKRVEMGAADVDDLWTLARVYFYGTYSPTGEWDTANFAHRNPEKALSILKKLQEVDPGAAVIRAQITVLRDLRRVDELFPLYNELAKIPGQDTWDVYNYLAYHALEKDSDVDKALRLYKLAQDADSTYWGYLDYYRLLILLGDFEGAAQVVASAGVTLEPRLRSLVEATRALHDSGRWRDAAERQARRLREEPFALVRESWKDSTDPFERFLALTAELLEPYKYDRNVLEAVKQTAAQFAVDYADAAPELSQFIDAVLNLR